MSYQQQDTEAPACEQTQLKASGVVDRLKGGNRYGRVVAFVAAFATIALGAAAILGGGARTTGASAFANLDSDDCAPCSFNECVSAQCGMEAPFLCTSGISARGCAPTAVWATSGVCDSCCSMEDCPETIAAGGTIDGACTTCDEDQCAAFGGYQRCGSGAPYVCVEGSARFGCSSDEFHWPAMESTQCSSCCDVSACP